MTNQNYIPEETKCRLKAGNACYYSVQKLLSALLLSKKWKLKLRVYETIILQVVPYGCGIWSLALREKYRLRVFENSIPRRIFNSRGIKWEWRKFHNEELHNLYNSPNIVIKYIILS